MAEEKNGNEGNISQLFSLNIFFLVFQLNFPLDFVQISEEEGRLKKDEEETKEMWKRKREHEEQWEGTREKRVSFQLHYVVFCFEIYYF